MVMFSVTYSCFAPIFKVLPVPPPLSFVHVSCWRFFPLSDTIVNDLNYGLLPTQVVFQLNKTHDVAGDDSCAFWDYADNSTAGEWSGMGCVRTNNKLLPSSIVECRCTHLTNFAVLTTPSARVSSAQNAVSLAVITYVGVAVSVPAMLLTVAVFASYRKLRTLGRVVTMHLCVNLSIALLLLVFGIDQTKDQELCIGVAASLHFFLLTSFAWMLVEGVRLYKAFVTVFECEKQKQTHYAAFAYACPGVIVGVTAAVLGRNA